MKGVSMSGYDKMAALLDEFGADEILESLMRSLSDDVLDDNAEFIARMFDFDFESEE